MTEEQELKNWNDRADWIQFGVAQGWISDPYCNTHDGGTQYWTEEEMLEWEEGGDPCQTVIRVLGVD
jgi:hypothetical protein